MPITALTQSLQAGLFSTAVATFLSLSIQDLRQSSQDISVFYLKNIYQHLADPNVSVPSVPSTVAAPPSFSPPKHTITVNLLWVLSLCINLTCAIMATMFQQWARQYVRFTQPPRRSPRRRARIRVLFSGSVDKLFIKTMGILLPCYLHFSIFLFFMGLIIYLFNVNDTLFIHTLWFFVLCMVTYTFLTFLPLFQTDSLLYTPISAFPASFVALLTCLVHSTFADRFRFKFWNVFEWLFEDVSNPVEKISLKRSSEIDTLILESTLNYLGDDDAQPEDFFRSIPSFFNSKWVKLLPTNLPTGLRDAFKEALYDFLDDTFRTTTIPESVKTSRLIIGLDASRAALGPSGPSWILGEILNENWPELLRSVEIGHSLRSWAYSNDEENALYIRSIISHVVASAENRNDRWLALAGDQLGMSEERLQHYLGHGDSILLANLINITCLTIRAHPPDWKFYTLPSKCDVSSTLPSLQHDFCALWNEIVLEAQNGKLIPTLILENFRPVYITLHPVTDASIKASSATAAENDGILLSSYPLCNIACHRSNPTPDDCNEAVADVSPAHRSRIQPVPHRSPILVSKIRPIAIPAHHTTRSPADGSSFGTVTDVLQSHTPVIPPSPLVVADKSVPSPPLNMAVVGSTQEDTGVSVAPSMTRLDLHPIPSGEEIFQQSAPVIPSSIVYGSPTSFICHVLNPALSGDMGPVLLLSSEDSVDLNIPITMEVSRRSSLSNSPALTHDIAADCLRPVDSQGGPRQS